MLNRLSFEITRQRKLIEERVSYEDETSTRVSLIDPLLRTLGWNVTDPAQVRLEYPTGNYKIDYVLLNEDGTPAAGLEAKKLHDPLPRHYPKLVKSSGSLFPGGQAGYFILTNGNIWQLYQGITDLDDIDTKRVFEVVIAPTPTVATGECAFALAQLWRPDYGTVPPISANSMRFLPTCSVPVTKGWTRMSSWTADGKPKAILRLPNGKECNIVNWNQLVPCIGDWLGSRELLSDSDLPVLSEDKNRFILSDTAKHPTGRPFKKADKLKFGWKFDKVNPVLGGHLRDAKQLLQSCNVDPGDVLVRVRAEAGS